MTRPLLIAAALLLLIPFAALALMSLLSRRPPNLGVTEGRLHPCPGTPNCVCSQDDGEHRVEPFPLAIAPDEAMAHLKTTVASFPRMQVVDETDNYLRAEYTSAVFRFVDDVEFLVDPEAGVVHVRSASRAGRSDFGVNRARVEAIREALLEFQKR